MTEPFVCVPLLSDEQHLEQIKDFTIDRESEYSHRTDKIMGLEAYLKRCAWDEDQNNEVRIYLIKDSETSEVPIFIIIRKRKCGMYCTSFLV